MNYFLKANKNLIVFSLIIFIVVPIFGINFFLSFLGNILLILFLIPVLLLLIIFLVFNSYKSKINVCNSCGAISFDSNNSCSNCGAEKRDMNNQNEIDENPSEKTIEVKAEEIK